MRCFSRRAAAVVLAAALFIPTIAAARSQREPRVRDKTELVRRVIDQIRRTFGVTTNSDVVGPPLPAPAPPPPTP